MTDLVSAEAVIISSASDFYKMEIEGSIKKVFLTPEDMQKCYEVDGKECSYKTIFDPDEVGENGELKGLSFIAATPEIKNEVGEKGFSYWYNNDRDFIDHVAEYYIDDEDMEVWAHGYEKPAWGGTTTGRKKKLPVAAAKGDNVFISLETNGRSGVNPALDRLVLRMLTGTTD